jgi:hypothetical protein
MICLSKGSDNIIMQGRICCAAYYGAKPDIAKPIRFAGRLFSAANLIGLKDSKTGYNTDVENH